MNFYESDIAMSYSEEVNITDKNQIKDAIENTSLYLNKILCSRDKISFSEATKELAAASSFVVCL
ncbi:hypothetical protein LOZ80_31200 [Paenibacillus sp. HWE-109]|uniref:hypothetical protein n=1 Tax=Paenibacillus sp. HWE-109 TaxID=1306526 RepID=UPI001EDF5A4C|nr:hypothetical protein [Paenibacillus sp. HWE-109]UKS25976.1 hypothetical protein LOZ80_31200 [Paenibacillus sp. HWE-109]